MYDKAIIVIFCNVGILLKECMTRQLFLSSVKEITGLGVKKSVTVIIFYSYNS